jgi:hypothetical protein
MPYSVGIGTVTYSFKNIVNQTIDRVRAFTGRTPATPVNAGDPMHHHFATGAKTSRLPLSRKPHRT